MVLILILGRVGVNEIKIEIPKVYDRSHDFKELNAKCRAYEFAYHFLR